MSYPNRSIWLTVLIVCSMVVFASHGMSASNTATAQVPEELRRSEAYTMYAKMLVQIDLIANPKTSSLPVTVSAIRPGTLVIEGRVPTAKILDYIQQNAKRISGLAVESQLEVAEVPEPLFVLPSGSRTGSRTSSNDQWILSRIRRHDSGHRHR